jgi:hypothetical protein
MSSNGALPSSGDKTYCFFVLQYDILQCFNWWFWMFNKIDDFSCYDTTKLNVAKMDFDMWSCNKTECCNHFFDVSYTRFHCGDCITFHVAMTKFEHFCFMIKSKLFWCFSLPPFLVLVAPCRGNDGMWWCSSNSWYCVLICDIGKEWLGRVAVVCQLSIIWTLSLRKISGASNDMYAMLSM